MNHQEAAQQLIDASRKNLGARDREAAAIQAQLASAHATLHLASIIEQATSGKPATNETPGADGEGKQDG